MYVVSTSTQRNTTQHFPVLSLRARDLYPSVLTELSDRIVLSCSSCHDGALHLPKTPDRPRKLAAWPAWQSMLESPSSALEALQAIPSPALRSTTQVRRLGFKACFEAVYLDASHCQPHDPTANASLCRDLPATHQSEFCVFF